MEALSYNKYISLNNVTVSFEKFGTTVLALNKVSLDISKGEWISIMGPNGSGKTTMLKAISKQLEHDAGEVEINSKSVNDMTMKELTTTLFYVNQNPLLGSIPQLTVWENLIATDFPGKSHNEATKVYSELLNEVSLLSHKDHLVQFLSGGQRQILTLLIAKMRAPEVLLLDEPLASLDPDNTSIARSIIDEMHKSGKTILYVTHDQVSANINGNKVIKLNQGQIIQ